MAAPSDIAVRKLLTVREEILTEGGRADRGDPLVKATALAVIANPYFGRPRTPELEELVATSGAIGTLLGERAVAAPAAPVESYGQAALVGLAGEQEHAAACLAGGFGDALRMCVGGGTRGPRRSRSAARPETRSMCRSRSRSALGRLAARRRHGARPRRPGVG